jgi:hypothetical protein
MDHVAFSSRYHSENSTFSTAIKEASPTYLNIPGE